MLEQVKMATEMGHYYNAMTGDMSSKLSHYMNGLQARYGDPRVYEMQQQEMAQQEARVVHKKSAKTAALLRSAYDARTEKNRELHSARLKQRTTPPSASSPQ
jgi:hypothetical protein